jgi:hypothetical protein
MPVTAGSEPALGERLEPACAECVDQHSDLDAVARGEGDRFQKRSTPGELARQRLREPGQPRFVEI